MVNQPLWRIVGWIALLTLTAGACNPFGGGEEEEPPPPPPPTEPPSPEGESIDDTLRFGAVLPLSGDLSEFGPTMQAAAELAVEDINAQGGVFGDVELLVEDSGTDPGSAGAATERLIAQGADVILGAAVSTATIGGVLEPAVQAERLVCSPTSAAPALTTVDDQGLFFRTVPSNVGEAVLLARRITAAGHDRVALIRRAGADALVLREELRNELDEAAEVVADVEVEPLEEIPLPPEPGDTTTTSAVPDGAGGEEEDPYRAAVSEVAAERPDVVVVLAHPPEGVVLLRGMNEVGLMPDDDVAVLVADTLVSDELAAAVDPDRIRILEGVRGVRPDPDAPESQAFDERLQEEKDIEVVDHAAQTYECVMIAALAALAADTDDPAEIAQGMVAITRDGSPCPVFEECVPPVLDGEDVRYTGVLDITFNDLGEPASGPFQVVEFDAEGDLEVVETATIELEPLEPVGPGDGDESGGGEPTDAEEDESDGATTTTTDADADDMPPSTLAETNDI